MYGYVVPRAFFRGDGVLIKLLLSWAFTPLWAISPYLGIVPLIDGALLMIIVNIPSWCFGFHVDCFEIDIIRAQPPQTSHTARYIALQNMIRA